MMEIKNLTYQIKDKKILDDINLLIKSKEKIAVIGPNGSGKTTLLRHLYKDINVSQGKILLNNLSIGKMKRNSYSKSVAVVSQENYNNYSGFTSEDIVMMGRYPYKGFFNDYDNNDKKIVIELTQERWVLEIYRTIIETLQGLAWMMLVFFMVSLIAYVIVRWSEVKYQKH